MRKPIAAGLAESVESLRALDAPGKVIGERVRGLLPAGRVKDVLSGVPLGHALHPLLTDVVIGSYTSALVLDAIGGEQARPAARKLIATGLAATPPTLITGWSDWADAELADAGVRRVGLVHAGTNAVSLALMAASLRARASDDHAKGVALGVAGASLLGLGGWLGGHMSYAQGVGVDNTAFEVAPTEWTATDVSDGDLANDQPRCASADGATVLLVRRNGAVQAIANTCTHRGAPLHEGEYADGTIRCPWHESVFRLDDGSVEQGPATFPQPAYDARVTDGRIEVRARA